MMRSLLRFLLGRLFRVRLHGLEHFAATGGRVLVVANHLSFLDPVLLWAFLPEGMTFAINTQIAKLWWVRPGLGFARTFAMDSSNPQALRTLAHHLEAGHSAVIFPEGRITVTGRLMKVYDGAALVAERTRTAIVVAHLHGPQYTPFSRMHGQYRLSWRPDIDLHIQPAFCLRPDPEVSGHERRHRAGLMLADQMQEAALAGSPFAATLYDDMIMAARRHGPNRIILEDTQPVQLSYRQLATRILALQQALPQSHASQPLPMGIMLPTAPATVVTLFALQRKGYTPAMLNFSAGEAPLIAACQTCMIQCVITARSFLEKARLESLALALQQAGIQVLYLEDLAQTLTPRQKIKAGLQALWHLYGIAKRPDPDQSARPSPTAVILFTSGSEGQPKGVALSHSNLATNCRQLMAVLDFMPKDTVLNVLPMFHSFGLTAGTLLPLISGMRALLYPSPLHYRVIPEVVYNSNATLLFGTSTFLAQYGKHAHPYDLRSLRYVFAGAEKLQQTTRDFWQTKFGIRILEGYGTTETSPVLAANTPMHYRIHSVGRCMPGLQYALETVPGIECGGKLHVRGPSIMQGYYLPDSPGTLQPTESLFGKGWYDTGDVAEVDSDGYIYLQGRLKRFAKVAGEMVPLTRIEALAMQCWPNRQHAVVTRASEERGELLILCTTEQHARRERLQQQIRQEGLSELWLPKEIRIMDTLPLLPTGKCDYAQLTALTCPPA